MLKNLLFCLFLPTFLFAQKAEYSRVKVFFDEQKNIDSLAILGIEVDHGHQHKNQYLINDFSKNEIEIIKNKGFKYEILIADAEAFYANQSAQNTDNIFWQCGTPYDFKHKTPSNFKLGSMAGYYTYQELLNILNDMHAKYPLLISKATAIDTFKTYEQRPILHLKISDNPNKKDTAESQLLYTALHHAREPASLSQMIYFMWYLLENYEKSPKIKYLLDNTELYFVPCVNPDGYIYNETQNPKGGGLWRKNRRINADGSVGVDLNRNYGYLWGKDDIGSAPNGTSETYRGTAPFSEPETRAIRHLCVENNFVAAMNYHTFGNLLLYPSDNFMQSPDSLFSKMGDLLTLENAYSHGSVSSLLNYNTNGDSNDWMLAEKNIAAFVPEVSGTGFWTPATLIGDVCADNLSANIALIDYANDGIIINNESPAYATNTTAKIDLHVQQIGQKSSNTSISIKPLTKNILTYNSTPKTIKLKQWAAEKISFNFQLQPTVKNGEAIKFEILKNNGFFTSIDTVDMTYQSVNFLISEKGNNVKNFDAPNDWAVTTKTFVSAPASITDSPDGNYLPNTIAHMTTLKPIKIPKSGNTYLRFSAKWQIERDKDFVTVGVMYTPNGSEEYLCGRYTQKSNADLVYQQPVFHGEQLEWVQEEMDLSLYAGEEIYLKFQFYSNDENEFDGIYIDDIQVWSPTNNVATTLLSQDWDISTYPTLTSSSITIDTKNLLEPFFDYQIINSFGEKISEKNHIDATAPHNIDVAELPKGLYFLNIINDKKIISVKKFVKM